ncbi:hypothetical protein SKTS_24210 [Sulfurimicrobium lacus]|uniref:Diguanylate cyclase n=1 Tax=Sulfurimicrobium lacus TaxID=2715678 RepID=A0A6F8VFJ6_9PROT|nr:hypothetical protein SKTS_24210 [Sulfurimicrobium lacus]
MAALAVALAMGAATLVLERAEGARLAQMHRVEILNQVSAVRARLEGSVQSRLVLARGLIAFVSTHPDIDNAQFQELAKVLVAQQKGVRVVELARNNVISHIYSLNENDQRAMGLDLMSLADEKDAIERAITSRRTIIAGPVNLVQGGVAFISRIPIYVTEPGKLSESGTYWGMAQVIMMKDDMLNEAGLTGNSFPDLRFALRGHDATGAAGEVIVGDAAVFSSDPVVADVMLPNGSWQIAAVPKKGWITPHTGWIPLVGSLFVVISGLLAWMLARAPVRLKILVAEATEEARRSEARLNDLNRELEQRIEVRTQALVQTNQELLKEAAERRQAEKELVERHAFSQALLKAQSDVDEGMLVLQDGGIVFANEAMARLTGYRVDELLGGMPYADLVHPDSRSEIQDKNRRRLAGEQFENRYETSIVTKEGERREVELAVAIVKNGEIIQTVVVVRDITERKGLQDNLRHMAHYDELTNLPNRALFFDRLERALADARRHGSDFAMLFIDLDGFKAVNDAYGHQAGDRLLQEVAHRMEQCVRESDTVARMGGDEFAVIVGDVAQNEDASGVAQKIIDSLSAPLLLDGVDCHIGASIGISLFPHDGETSETLLTKADGAMYSAKNKGKNTYCFVQG